MRDVALTVILLGILPLILYRAHVGLLAWAWVAFMNPHREVYSYLQGANLNVIIAGLTVAAILFSKEKWFPILNPTLGAIIIFAAWTTLTTLTALDYSTASVAWSVNMKTFLLALFVAALIDRPSRMHALMLVIVISLGYWGVLSGLKVFASLGHATISGPPNSMIADNNSFALALVLCVPIVEYCRHVSENRWLRLAFLGVLILMMVTILGTYSRGGLISFAVIAALFLWRSKNRFLAASVLAIPILVGMSFLPQQWADRMSTIETFRSDQSFQSRVSAWKTALRIGLDRPLLGAGFKATENISIYNHYKSEGDTMVLVATHSAYMQVLAEHGFVGLSLFVLMLVLAIRNCRRVVKECSGREDLHWLAFLAGMLEIGFIGYAVGATALSVAYYDVFLVLIVFSSLLREYSKREIAALSDRDQEHMLRKVPGYVMAS